MAKITLELVLGDDRDVFDNLRAALPQGDNNLARGVVVPSHPRNLPQTLKFDGVTPDESYILDIIGEWQTPAAPRTYFVPTGSSYNITLSLPYGPSTLILHSSTEEYRFFISSTNYATLFRAYAREITEYSKIPLQQLEESISSPMSFRLATPMLAGLTSIIPADLEILSSLAHKLLVKNLLHNPGRLGATTELLAAFSASNPVFFKMQNTNKFDSPLFRSEEVFQGYEAHIWLPNREIERWRAFTQLLNNLPQLYTLKQITEGEIYVQQGGKLRRHLFDFTSPLANSITTGLTYLTDCFLRLFTVTVAVESEHILDFCQASYILDQKIETSLTPTDADPLNIIPWSEFSLSGRFGQQYDISPQIHEWHYDSPLIGEVDGVNRYFGLSYFPASTSGVKIFVDGLLKRLYIDYRISLSDSISSGSYRVSSMPQGPLVVSSILGLPRPFMAPVFSSLECRENANLQMLLTGIEQGLDRVSFIISHPPNTVPSDDPQSVAVHFATPKTYNSGITGENQYGQIPMVAGITSYELIFNQPTATLDYQLLVSLTVDPMPSGDPTLVTQVFHLARERTQTGTYIDFSEPLPDNVILNWWVIEDDTVSLERGTLSLDNGTSSIQILFSDGPYFDPPVVLLQLWEIQPTFVDAGQYLVSAMSVGPMGTLIRFSSPIVGDNYRLDYVIFPARDGNFVEFYEPPIGLLEAHYDTKWEHWINSGLTPIPDGIRTSFNLPYPVTDPKSVYLTLNGRLMTQGANRQYTIEGNDKVLFTFPPTSNQIIWAVYPVSSNTEELHSAWDQGFLNYLPMSSGEYATGWIKLNDTILIESTVSIDGLIFEAVNTATGLVVNGNAISVGSSLTWGTLGVVLTGVPDMPSSDTEFQVGISKEDDNQALIDVINNHPLLSLHYVALSGGNGFTIIRAKTLGGTLYNETLSAFGNITATNITGDRSPNSYNSRLIYLGEHVVSVVFEHVDETSDTFYRAEHPFYEGLGVTVITTDTLPDPLVPDTVYYVTNPTLNTFQLSATPYGGAIDITTKGSGYHTFTSQDIEIATSTFAFPTTVLSFTGVTTVNSPVISGLMPHTTDLTVGMSVSGTAIPSDAIIVSIDSQNQITLNRNATVSTSDTLQMENVFRPNEPVGFVTNGTLPTGLVVGQKYYVVNITPNRFQVSETVDGIPVSFTDGGTDTLIVYSIPRFVAGNTKELDSQALTTEINKHPITSAKLTATATDGLITLTAKDIGVRGNMLLAVSDPTVSFKNLMTGREITDDIYGTSKICYYYDAPVTTLDGLSTKLRNQYGGDKFIFDTSPTLKQESYYISEVYPMDYHPLDSTVANLPCNYPKGIFTQGFGTHLNETEILVDQQGTLLIATANLPVQERPQGIIDGVNTVFTLSFTSCAGQDSLMIWLDGIFQSPDKYVYMDVGSYGQITFLTPPAVGQELWAWYLPYGAACADERVNALVGSIDDVNQIFDVPDSPWVDIPALVVFLEGLFVLQDVDYSVISVQTQIQFLGSLAPATGQSLWGHYNLGSTSPVDNWRQLTITTTDGITDTFMITHMLSSELPLSTDSVLVFLDGLNQGGHFTIEVDLSGNPTGNIIFNEAPEANRRLDVAYIRN